MLILYQPCQQQRHWKIESTTISYPTKEHVNSSNKSEQFTLLQTITHAQILLTDRLIKNVKTITLLSRHSWSKLVIYKRDQFDRWRCLTCYEPMGKKDWHRNSILYPEYFTSRTTTTSTPLEMMNTMGTRLIGLRTTSKDKRRKRCNHTNKNNSSGRRTNICNIIFYPTHFIIYYIFFQNVWQNKVTYML